jgi:hypothetical protein
VASLGLSSPLCVLQTSSIPQGYSTKNRNYQKYLNNVIKNLILNTLTNEDKMWKDRRTLKGLEIK